MNKIKIMILGLLASCLIVSGVKAQGLIGQGYFGVDGGWERLENGVEDDGWGAGVEINSPFPLGPQGRFGTDLRIRGDYMDVLDRDIFDVEGVLRGYMLAPETAPAGFTPFVGAGFGWVDFDEVESTYLPVEAGVEFAVGPFSVVPVFRYSFAFDSAVEDFWSAGATAVYWFPTGWGVTAGVTYTDYDEIQGVEVIDSGIGARLGLVFAY